MSLATYRLGMWFALASVSMLFMGLTSAYVVRLGSDADWRAIPIPNLLMINTAVIAASSVTMERARRMLRPGALSGVGALNVSLLLTFILGIAFVCGQYAAWRELSGSGIYLGTNPHSSFFYLLTGLHGLHLLGGILALGFLVLKARLSGGSRPKRHLVELIAIYWHFMGVLWVYLLLLLFTWS